VRIVICVWFNYDLETGLCCLERDNKSSSTTSGLLLSPDCVVCFPRLGDPSSFFFFFGRLSQQVIRVTQLASGSCSSIQPD